MKQERFSEAKIIGILREAEKGEKPIADLSREHSIAEQTFYRWRRKYGGLNTSDVQHSTLGYQTPAEFAAGGQLSCKPDVECEVDARMP